MRNKKNREVNIFSASVVDLFASALGVFLIVSIVAMANQKKEIFNSSDNMNIDLAIATMKGDIEELRVKNKKILNENFHLKAKSISREEFSFQGGKKASISPESKKSERDFEQKVKIEVQKSKIEHYQSRIEVLKLKNKESQDLILDLERKLKSVRTLSNQNLKGIPVRFENAAIGSKIRLESVHFYPGTDRSIEPYSTREIQGLARYLQENPLVKIEVSGHIFETRKSIKSGNAQDVYNLSGRRARHVCAKLIDFGVLEKRLRCVGYGAQRFIKLTDDQYSESAQLNRRVEVEILSK